MMTCIAPKLSVEIVVGQGWWYVYTELTEGVSNNIHYPALSPKINKLLIPFYKVSLSTCSEC